MVKMSDVARLANVSTATVSRVLHKPFAVKEATRQKVLKVVAELNYHPNVLARNFRTNKTNTILVVVPTLTNTVIPEILGGVDTVASAHHYRVLLRNTNNTEEHHVFNELMQKQVDGVILLTTNIEETLLTEISEQYPVVLVSEFLEGSTLPTVSIDNVKGGQMATDHLITLGHDRIAHIAGPHNSLLSRDRLNGYKRALAKRRLPYDTLLVQEGDFTYQSGYKAMMSLLTQEEKPTAVFASNDEMAMGAIKAAKALGLKVPRDLAVVGFDNITFSSVFEPELTTIAQPLFAMGQQSMTLLLKLIANESILDRQLTLDSKLVIRESCGTKSFH